MLIVIQLQLLYRSTTKFILAQPVQGICDLKKVSMCLLNFPMEAKVYNLWWFSTSPFGKIHPHDTKLLLVKRYRLRLIEHPGHTVARLRFRHRAATSGPLIFYNQRSQLRQFGHLIKNISWKPPFGGFLGYSHQEDTQVAQRLVSVKTTNSSKNKGTTL